MTEVVELIEELASEICDKYCKYPDMPIPDGKDENWLWEEGGPCWDCPLVRGERRPKDD